MKVWEINHNRRDKNTEKLVENFTAKEDIIYDQKLTYWDILGSIAHLIGLKSIGLLTKDEATKLKQELVKLLEEEIELTPEDEDIHSKIESILIERLGELGEKLHTGRSRNDQILVDIRLYTKKRLFVVIDALLELARSLLDFARENVEVPMPGYTHCRKAMPSSVGLWTSAFVEALLDDLTLLESGFVICDQSPLGAGAGYGVPLALNRELTAKLLGFRKVQNNSLYVMNSRGKFEFTVLSCLGSINLDLSRLCADLILFSGEEFGFLTLPVEFTTGSSIMPQKRNPDTLELIRGRSSRLLANISRVYSLINGLSSGYSRDLQEIKGPLIEGFETTEWGLKILSPMIEGLKINKGRLKESFDQQIMATDKVFEKVRKGVSFRNAYREVKKKLKSEKDEPVKSEEIYNAIQSRNHQGGPGNLGLSNLTTEIDEKKTEWRTKRENFDRTLDRLIEAKPKL